MNETQKHRIGIPYADSLGFLKNLDTGGIQGELLLCPICWKQIPCFERKDFESFTGKEYQDHYVNNHNDKNAEDQ